MPRSRARRPPLPATHQKDCPRPFHSKQTNPHNTRIMRNSAQERAFLRFCGNCAHTMRNSKPKAAIFAAKFQKQTKMKEYYLHITAPKNVRNIMKEGLMANADGVIHLFDTFRMEATAQLVNIPDSGNAAEYEVKTIILIGDDIAIKKGLKRYALLKISRDGINTEPTPETTPLSFRNTFGRLTSH